MHFLLVHTGLVSCLSPPQSGGYNGIYFHRFCAPFTATYIFMLAVIYIYIWFGFTSSLASAYSALYCLINYEIKFRRFNIKFACQRTLFFFYMGDYLYPTDFFNELITIFLTCCGIFVLKDGIRIQKGRTAQFKSKGGTIQQPPYIYI